jgi:hypothetical protein
MIEFAGCKRVFVFFQGRNASMTRYFSVFCILLSCMFAAASWASAPKIVVDQENFNFGRIYQGEKVEHTFRFQNTGDAPLNVEKVRTSCGCTAALLSTKIIEPGETGGVSATFDSARFRGEVIKTIYLYSDDPLKPVTQLYLRGSVKPEILQDPERVELGPLQPGVEKEVHVTLTNQGEREITFLSIQVTAPDLRAEFSSDVLLPGKSVQVLIKATPREGMARVSGYVIVKTSSSHVPELRIPVYGTVTVAPGG